MGDPSGPIEENGGQNGDTDGPSSLIGMGPPSPLTGSYLLIILGEPHSAEHKDIILQKLVKGKCTISCSIVLSLILLRKKNLS